MLVFTFRAGLRCGLLMVPLVIGWVSLLHVFQTPLPAVLYSQRDSLYIAEPECWSLLSSCSIQGRRLMDSLYSIPAAQWSPDGEFVAVHLYDHWAIYPADCLLGDQDCRSVTLDPFYNDVRIAWGPGGNAIAFLDAEGSLNILSRGCWDHTADTCLRRSVPVTDMTNPLIMPAWSADGARMAFYGVLRRELFVLDMSCLDTPTNCPDALKSAAPGMSPRPSFVLIAPDGNSLVFTGDPSGAGVDDQLFVLDVETGRSRQLTSGSRATVAPDWSRDGRYLVFASLAAGDSADLQIDALDLSTGIRVAVMVVPGQDLKNPGWGYPK